MTSLQFLQLIGLGATTLTLIVVYLCARLWNSNVNRSILETKIQAAKSGYEYCQGSLDEGATGTQATLLSLAMVVYYVRRKRAQMALYPQFWAIFWFIMYMGAISMVSLWLYSLHPPCEMRHDCPAVKERGIYVGDEHA